MEQGPFSNERQPQGTLDDCNRYQQDSGEGRKVTPSTLGGTMVRKELQWI